MLLAKQLSQLPDRDFIVAAVEAKALLFKYTDSLYAAVLDVHHHVWTMYSSTSDEEVELSMDFEHCSCNQGVCKHIRMLKWRLES